MREEHDYTRGGAWTYLAAWDVHRAKIFGRCEAKGRIKPFDRLVDQVMSQAPYRRADRIFSIVDNASSHGAQPFVECLKNRWPNAIAVHLTIHASWLNQIEIYFAIVQKKAPTPNDFPSLQMVEKRLLDFQRRYQEVAYPFRWKFTRKNLKQKLKLVSDHVIKQYQPSTSQESTAEELPTRDKIQECSSAYAHT